MMNKINVKKSARTKGVLIVGTPLVVDGLGIEKATTLALFCLLVRGEYCDQMSVTTWPAQYLRSEEMELRRFYENNNK